MRKSTVCPNTLLYGTKIKVLWESEFKNKITNVFGVDYICGGGSSTLILIYEKCSFKIFFKKHS